MLQRSYQCPLFTWPFFGKRCVPTLTILRHIGLPSRGVTVVVLYYVCRSSSCPSTAGSTAPNGSAAPLMTVQQHLGKTKSERWRFRREWYASFWGMLLAPRLLVHQAPRFWAGLIYALFMFDERTRTLAHRSTGCVGKVLNHIMTHIHHTVQKRLIACAPPYQSVVGGDE